MASRTSVSVPLLITLSEQTCNGLHLFLLWHPCCRISVCCRVGIPRDRLFACFPVSGFALGCYVAPGLVLSIFRSCHFSVPLCSQNQCKLVLMVTSCTATKSLLVKIERRAREDQYRSHVGIDCWQPAVSTTAWRISYQQKGSSGF